MSDFEIALLEKFDYIIYYLNCIFQFLVLSFVVFIIYKLFKTLSYQLSQI